VDVVLLQEKKCLCCFLQIMFLRPDFIADAFAQSPILNVDKQIDRRRSSLSFCVPRTSMNDLFSQFTFRVTFA